MTQFLHTIDIENVDLIRIWFKDRGGICVWSSVNLSNPGASWTSPLRNADGTPVTKPNWQCANEPSLTITDPSQVGVVTSVELERFRVAVRRGSQGLSFKLTDASSAKVRKRCDHWRERRADGNVTYRFDYSTQECVILGADKTISLKEYEESHA